MIKCPNCSAELKYDVDSQSVTCEYCGSKFNPKELNTTVKKAGEMDDYDPDRLIEGKSYTCSQCGAKLLTFDETAITFCSYCGSQAMIESKMMKTNMPDYIIPFKKNKDECINNYKKKLSKAIFAPNYMKSEIVVSKFRGIYMPYCIYTLGKKGNIENKGSKFKKRRGDYDYYDDYRIDADIDAEYSGISYDLVSKFYDQYSQAIPFNHKEMEPFNANYLTGFYADTKDVTNNIYDGEVTSIVRNNTTSYLSQRREFRKYGCSSPVANLDITERKMGMFPIYFLAIRDKDEQHVHYAVINGQTGKVAMDLPIDFKKYIIASIILTIPVFLLFELSLFLIPSVVVGIAIAFSLISMIISNSQLNKVYEKEHHTDDKGFVSANEKKAAQEKEKEESKNEDKKDAVITEKKEVNAIKFTLSANKDRTKKKAKYPFMEKITKYLYKQIIAVIIGFLVLAANPVHDYYYYGAAIISFALTTWAFRDLVKEHNLLVSNKLPQLEKRGGDEHE